MDGRICAFAGDAVPFVEFVRFPKNVIPRDTRMKFWPKYTPKVRKGQPAIFVRGLQRHSKRHLPPSPISYAISLYTMTEKMVGHWVNGLGVGQSRPANLRGAILGSAGLPLRPRRSFADSDPSAIYLFAHESRATRRFLRPRRYLGRSVAALPAPVVLCLGYSFCGYLSVSLSGG